MTFLKLLLICTFKEPNLAGKRTNFAGKKDKFCGKSLKKLNSPEFMEFVFFPSLVLLFCKFKDDKDWYSHGVVRLLPGNVTCLLMCKPGHLQMEPPLRAKYGLDCQNRDSLDVLNSEYAECYLSGQLMESSGTPFFILLNSLHLQTTAIDNSADYLILINMVAQL